MIGLILTRVLVGVLLWVVNTYSFRLQDVNSVPFRIGRRNKLILV